MFLVAPISVFAVLSFFGIIGWAVIAGLDDSYQAGPDGTPDYAATINKEANLVAYWRLGGGQPAKFPTTGGDAKSDTGLHNGDYFLLAQTATDKARHSPHITAGTGYPRRSTRTSCTLSKQHRNAS